MSAIKLFESKKVRNQWDTEKEMWYFSIVDVIEILTDSSIPKRYWSDLKKKLTKEGSQLYEKIVQLKFEVTDGKKYATDCLDTPNLLSLIKYVMLTLCFSTNKFIAANILLDYFLIKTLQNNSEINI